MNIGCLGKSLVRCGFLSLCFLPLSSSAGQKEILIDTVVATVNDRPITLSEVGKRLSPPRNVSIADLKSNPDLKLTLDSIIFEKLLSAEADRRGMKVSDEDVNRYIKEVADKNSITPEAMEGILKKENKTMADYKDQVKIEILKSRIASSYIRSSATVTDEEVSEYIKNHSPNSATDLKSGDSLIQLRQLLISKDKHSEAEVLKILSSITSAIKDGESLEDLVKKWSDSPDKEEGGLLTKVAEKDLAPQIFDAIMGLDEGKVSRVVETPMGYQFFEVISREKHEGDSTSTEEEDPNMRAMVKKQLEKQKMESKMATFFENELLKTHTVEKKI